VSFVCNLTATILIGLSFSEATARAQTAPPGCPRPSMGSAVTTPLSLSSVHGVLKVELAFRSQIDPDGSTRYCYVYQGSAVSPTLRLSPGDELLLTLRNELPAAVGGTPVDPCANHEMTDSSTNLHFHGLDVPPTCHQDDVIHTLIPAGETFEYRVKIPATQPPGLYWYHPHPHGYSERQVMGGASGALIVEGIERVRPSLDHLPERILILRDQGVVGRRIDSDDSAYGPGKDISINFVPVKSPLQIPAVIAVKPLEKEFWRVLNASADTYFDLEALYRTGSNPAPQPLELVALDGTPIESDSKVTHILLAPGARAEFLVQMPAQGSFAQLVTLRYDTGPDGENHPFRVIANLVSRAASSSTSALAPSAVHATAGEPLHPNKTAPSHSRKLYFSEDRQDLKDPRKKALYYLTVEGRTPKVFDMASTEPDIVVRQGTVEDWTIENRATEAHVFHIHQLHFAVLERDGKKVADPSLRDTIDLPYWDGKGADYPSVKLRMDFRSPDIIGTFLFHCHILEHEDGGMMGSIEVVP
jgi:FtsP/CotA-like multicopper oxidase with cupredoxin domain